MEGGVSGFGMLESSNTQLSVSLPISRAVLFDPGFKGEPACRLNKSGITGRRCTVETCGEPQSTGMAPAGINEASISLHRLALSRTCPCECVGRVLWVPLCVCMALCV